MRVSSSVCVCKHVQGSLRGLRVITTVGEPLTSQLANRVAGSLPDGSGEVLRGSPGGAALFAALRHCQGHRGLSVTLRNFYGASESSCSLAAESSLLLPIASCIGLIEFS